jgi:hypothetical protein
MTTKAKGRTKNQGIGTADETLHPREIGCNTAPCLGKVVAARCLMIEQPAHADIPRPPDPVDMPPPDIKPVPPPDIPPPAGPPDVQPPSPPERGRNTPVI